MRAQSLALFAAVIGLIPAACNDAQGAADTTVATSADSHASASDTAGGTTADAPETTADTASVAPETAYPETADTSPLGGNRPATVTLPSGYDAAKAWPLVILLHGYSANGAIQDAYLQFSNTASDSGFIAVVPDGTADGTGAQFWNSDPAWCCNFGHSTVDDKGYLNGLIDEAKTRYRVDPARVYFVGHSNGGFMAYRMACDFADRVAAVVSLAGSLPLSAADCAPSEPVSVLQIHGTLDPTIPYPGVPGEYPGAKEITQRWATYDACPSDPVAGADAKDYDGAVLGAETTTETRSGCAHGTEVALWTLTGSTHIPAFQAPFTADVFAWLAAHPKTQP